MARLTDPGEAAPPELWPRMRSSLVDEGRTETSDPWSSDGAGD